MPARADFAPVDAAARTAARDDDAVHPLTVAAWRRWLSTHHARDAGTWLISYKQATGLPRFTYDAAVEEALCFGWVDSRVRALDAKRGMLWFAPRRPRSAWSATNKARVERLIAEGRMAPPGLAVIEAARANGAWGTLDGVEALEVPADLAAAFRRHAGSARQFDAFPRSVKRGILEWIVQAKRAETRARRIEETASLAAKGIRANQWRQP